MGGVGRGEGGKEWEGWEGGGSGRKGEGWGGAEGRHMGK